MKRIETILFDEVNYRLFGAILAAEIIPLSISDRWILLMTGQSSYDVALSRPMKNLASHGAMTKDTMHLAVVPRG